ncbi:kinase-like domain-containing protein, partial [Mycena vulgaris]
QGFDYLHSRNIVHGDLRGTNILISDDGSVCLSDFGLTTAINDGNSSTGIIPSSSDRAGSIRWFTLELISPAAFGCERFVRTPASDVYAYVSRGTVQSIFKVVHGTYPPFSYVTDVVAMLTVIAGERPEKPEDLREELWDVAVAAWASDSRARATI